MTTHIIKTKFIPPANNRLWEVPRLHDKYRQIDEHSVIILEAGPGYGKSSTVQSFLQKYYPQQYYWYSIDKQDMDTVLFFINLIYSFRIKHQDFGSRALKLLKQREKPGQVLREVIDILLNDILNILTTDKFLILDDFHLVSDNEKIVHYLEYFIDLIPPDFHLLILTRKEINFGKLSNWRLKQKAILIEEKHFRLNPEEIETFFETQHEIYLEKEDCQQLYDLSEGWIMALDLIGQTIKKSVPVEKILSAPSDSLKILFDYLAAEVLDKQSSRIKEFLVKTSVLRFIRVDICNILLDIEDSKQILEELSRSGLFVNKLDQNQYRYHHLFHEFLQKICTNKYDKQQLHLKAASICRQLDEKENAIYHSLLGKDHEQAAELIVAKAGKLLEMGRLETLKAALERLPESVFPLYPDLYIHRGDVFRYTSKFNRALIAYKKAEEIYREGSDNFNLSNVLQKIAMIYLDTVQPVKADTYLKEALELRDRESEWEEVTLLKMRAENKANEGHIREARKLHNRVREIAENEIRDYNLEARVQLRTGRLKRARKTLEKKINRESGYERIPRSHRESMLVLSLIYSFQGQPQQAQKYAEKGIKISRRFHSPFIEAVAHMRFGHAYQLLEEKGIEKARNSYFKALRIVDDLKIVRGRAEPLWGLSLMEAFYGEQSLGLKYGNEGLEISKKSGDEWLAAMLMIALGINYYSAQETARAEKYFIEARDNFNLCNDRFGSSVSKLWLSLIDFKRKENTGFKQLFKRLIKDLIDNNYDFLVLRPTLLGMRDPNRLAPVLLAGKKYFSGDSSLNTFLVKLNLNDIENQPGYSLKINSFGQLQVKRGQRVVEDSDWHRKKALELLKLLIVHRRDYIPREKILYLLWPNKDQKKAARNFKVVLNSLNKVLEPERKPRQEPFFIQRRRSAYGLNKDEKSCYIDAAKFEQLIERGEKAQMEKKRIDYYFSAINLYKGDFLADSLYLEWVREERERLKDLFLNSADEVMEYYYRKGQYQDSIKIADQLLGVDNCWERAYLYKMKAYRKINRRSMAIKCYKRCKQVLDRELNVTPIQKIEKLYQKLT